jgi:uncharacterized protein (TIGR02246 family)
MRCAFSCGNISRMRVTLFPITAFVILAGCAQAPLAVVDTREADAAAIAAVEEMAAKGWDAHNVEQVAAIYAPDASLLIPNVPTIKGSDVAVSMKEMFADPNLSLKFARNKTEVAKSGDIGYTMGTYVLNVTDAKTKKVVVEKGRYLTVFAKQADGSWKAIQDMNTPDGPAMPVDAKK